jgi:mitochondrial import inner membrane translocase subunit TIM44
LAETVIDALDDSGSAKHAGFEEKEARRKRRQMRLAKAGKDSMTSGRARVKANAEAGQALVVHKDSPRQERWNKLKETNPLFRQLSDLRQQFDESENPVVSSIRGFTQTIGSWFDENESAQVQRMMKAMDPAFTLESFERELREYIVPEVVDAYLSADQEALKAWCGEAVSFINFGIPSNAQYNLLQTYNVLWATMEQYLKQGLISDSKVLDIRQVEVSSLHSRSGVLLTDEPVGITRKSSRE